MKKILNLMYLCFIVVNNVSAQSTKGFPKIETEIIGQSKLSVYYQLDDNSTNKKKSGETVLQILDSKSKYFDVVESDAIAYNNAALTGELNKDNIAEGLKVFGKYVYKGVILKDFSTSKVVVNDLIGGKRFEYEEGIPKIEWKIGKEQKEILGYQCTKATAKFRGRDY
ncbi:GLPGLI family protein, partial [Myroides odoratimimus]|uniref:GLPGLI family protein n=1 Tax=Myroides odoratimimus TaxID=76832 RepID=UPI0038B784EA